MRRGLIYWVNLRNASPPEMGKTRPAVVVSNSEQNEILPTVVVVPLSSRPREIWPLRLGLRHADGRQSFAVVPGIRQVHKGRLVEATESVSRAFLGRLDEALRLYLGD